MNFPLVSIDIDELHQKISRDAADIANADERLVGLVPGLEGSVFHEASGRSNYGGLTLEFMPGLEQAGPQVVAVLQTIGREAIQKAIAENKALFVGAIVGEARKGRNYFNRFVGTEGQFRLF